MKKRIFCLLLVVALMASLGMTVFAESETVTPPQETAETTETTPAAPEVPAEPETAPAPEAPAAPAEPAEVPATETETEGEPAADVPAAGEEVPGVDDAPAQDAAPAPNDEPAPISEPAPAPISDLTLKLAADKTEISTQDAYACWLAYVGGNADWKTNEDFKKGYITLTLQDAPEDANDIQWFVETDKGGASAGHDGDGSPATTCVTVAEGNKLYLMGGSDLVGCPDGFTCTITVYATYNGRTSDTVQVTFKSEVEPPKPTATPEPDSKIPDDMLDKSGTAGQVDKGVWLHVINGDFTKTDKYPVVEGKASVWVEFTDEDARTLPTDLPGVTRSNGTFDGWYTQAPNEELKSENEYSYWHTVKTNGKKVEPGKSVPDGVEILYAAFTDKAQVDETDKRITFYLDWNGINGMFGHCLTCTREYKQGNNNFTPEDALVVGLNYAADSGETFDKDQQAVTWENLKTFWEGKTFNGYTFKGWSLKEKDGDIITQNTPITNGMSFYAQWEKVDGSSSQNFEREDPAAGPLEYLRILGDLNTSMTGSRHADKGASFTFSLFRTPVRAAANDVTWSVDVVKAASDPIEAVQNGNKKESISVKAGNTAQSADGGIKLEATGLLLTVTCVEGDAYSVTVTKAEATNKNNATISTNVPATVNFYHSANKWTQQVAPTCVKSGTETSTCSVCGKDLTRSIVPLEHTWKSEVTKAATCTVDGVKQDQCTVCHMTFDEYQQWLSNRGKPVVNPPHKTEVVPATGHTYEATEDAKPIRVENGAKVYKVDCIHGDDSQEMKCGDVNGDGTSDALDAVLTFNYAMGKYDKSITDVIGDVNCDGATDALDAVLTFNYAMGKRDTLG